MGPLPYDALRDPIIPLVRSKCSTSRTNDLTRPPVAATAKKQNKTVCTLVVWLVW